MIARELSWRRLALALLVWLALSEIAAPFAIRTLWSRAVASPAAANAAAGRAKVVERAVEGLREYESPEEAIASWHTSSRWLAVAAFWLAVVFVGTRAPRFGERFVPKATPGALGAIRAWVAGILMVSALWENLPSSAAIPRSLVRPDGVMRLPHALPIGFDRFLASAPALAAFQTVTVLLLAAAMLGWRTRASVPLAAAAYLVFAGIFREYAWFYHTGLVPLFLLVVLATTPCGDGFSLDRLLAERRAGCRHRRGSEPSDPTTAPPLPARDVATADYGWARYLVWTALAMPYVEAGLSKLRRGGLEWMRPENLKSVLLVDTLNPMQFDWGVTLRLLHAPDLLFGLIGVATIAGETGFGLVLVSARARRVMPLVTVGMHLGIWLLQNVLFFDLILLQAIFFDWSPLLARLRRRLPPESSPAAHLEPALAGTGPRTFAWPRRLRILVLVFVTLWALRVEEYPLTAMQMYSKPDLSGRVEWYAVRATLESGEVREAPIEATIPALRDARYRRCLRRAFRPETESVARDLLARVAELHNRGARTGEKIVRIAAERWSWNYRDAPEDSRHGTLDAEVVVDVAPAALAEKR